MKKDVAGKVILKKENKYTIKLSKEESYKVVLTKEENVGKVNLFKEKVVTTMSAPEVPTAEPRPQLTQPPPATPSIYGIVNSNPTPILSDYVSAPTPHPTPTSQVSQSTTHPSPPPPSPPSGSPPPPRQDSGGKSNKGVFLLAILAVLAVIFFWQNSGGKNTEDASASNSNSTDIANTLKQQYKSQLPSKIDQQGMARRNFSLGGLDIGDSEQDVHDWLGKELEITDPQNSGHRHYNYPDMEVVITNGRVTGFVSRTDKVYTKQGIHQGSSWQEVRNIYGTTPFAESEYDGAVLKEYLYEIDGKEYLLRFAIKQGVVEYISGRMYEREKPTTSTSVSANGNQAVQAMVDYHKAITDKNFSRAMNLLSTPRRQAFRSLDHFREGYRTTLSSVMDRVTVAQERDNEVVLYYHITARDRTDNGRTIIQGFDGTVTMIKEQGEWKIGPAESRKTSEHWE